MRPNTAENWFKNVRNCIYRFIVIFKKRLMRCYLFEYAELTSEILISDQMRISTNYKNKKDKNYCMRIIIFKLRING